MLSENYLVFGQRESLFPINMCMFDCRGHIPHRIKEHEAAGIKSCLVTRTLVVDDARLCLDDGVTQTIGDLIRGRQVAHFYKGRQGQLCWTLLLLLASVEMYSLVIISIHVLSYLHFNIGGFEAWWAHSMNTESIDVPLSFVQSKPLHMPFKLEQAISPHHPHHVLMAKKFHVY